MNSESEYVRKTQISPVAGIWLCDSCGRSIQVITSSEVEKVQSFICVCGAEMRPGPEHSVVDESIDKQMEGRVVDG